MPCSFMWEELHKPWHKHNPYKKITNAPSDPVFSLTITKHKRNILKVKTKMEVFLSWWKTHNIETILQKETYLKVNYPVVNPCSRSLMKVVSRCTPIQTNCKTCQTSISKLILKIVTKEIKIIAEISHQLLLPQHFQQKWFPREPLLLLVIVPHILTHLTIGLCSPFCTN